MSSSECWYLYYFSFYTVGRFEWDQPIPTIFPPEIQATMMAASMPCMSGACIYLYRFGQQPSIFTSCATFLASLFQILPTVWLIAICIWNILIERTHGLIEIFLIFGGRISRVKLLQISMAWGKMLHDFQLIFFFLRKQMSAIDICLSDFNILPCCLFVKFKLSQQATSHKAVALENNVIFNFKAEIPSSQVMGLQI